MSAGGLNRELARMADVAALEGMPKGSVVRWPHNGVIWIKDEWYEGRPWTSFPVETYAASPHIASCFFEILESRAESIRWYEEHRETPTIHLDLSPVVNVALGAAVNYERVRARTEVLAWAQEYRRDRSPEEIESFAALLRRITDPDPEGKLG